MKNKYNMRNLNPDKPESETEVFYILGRLDEKEAQLGGLEAVLTLEYHHAGGPRFNVRSRREAETMQRDNTTGPEIWKYWTRDQILEKEKLLQTSTSY